MRIYKLYGLAFRSEIRLPTNSTARHWDIELLWGMERSIPASLPEGRLIASLEQGAIYSCVELDNAYVIRYPQICEFHVSRDLRRVVVDRASGQDALVELLAEASLPALLLGLMGEFCLHASSVGLDGTGVAFVGQAGTGKSTLAALTCLEGAQLIGDDLLRLGDGPDALFCYPGGNEVRIRAASPFAEYVKLRREGRVTADDRLGLPFESSVNAVPFGLMIVPTIETSVDEPTVKKLSGSSALRAAAVHARVLGWHGSRSGSQFRMMVDIARRVPVYQLAVPFRPDSWEDLGRGLVDLLSGIMDDRTVAAF